MSNSINFRIAQPNKVIKSGEVRALILPAFESNLTVISGRAPSIVLLTEGMIQILNDAWQPIERYFVRGGVANIADDMIEIASEEVIDGQNINLEEIKSKIEACQQDCEKHFLQVIFEELISLK